MPSDTEPRYRLVDSNGNVVGSLYAKAGGTLAIQEGTSGADNEVTVATDGTLTTPALDTEEASVDHLSNAGHSVWADPSLASERRIPIPRFERVGDGQMFTPGDSSWITSNTINWPTIIPAYKTFDDPLGRYYLYYSAHNQDGVGLAYSDDLTNWTDHGKIISNGVENDVVYDEAAGELRLYANHNNHDIRLWTSSNGVDGWSAYETVFTTFDGHAGYPRVFKSTAGYYMAAFLKYREDESIRTLRFSDDGRTNWRWVKLRAGERDMPTGDATANMAFNSYSFQPHYNGYLTPFRKTTPSSQTLRIGYSNDGMHISDMGETLAPSEPWEDDLLSDPYLFWADNRLYMTYAGGNNGGGQSTAYGLAVADFGGGA